MQLHSIIHVVRTQMWCLLQYELVWNYLLWKWKNRNWDQARPYDTRWSLDFRDMRRCDIFELFPSENGQYVHSSLETTTTSTQLQDFSSLLPYCSLCCLSFCILSYFSFIILAFLSPLSLSLSLPSTDPALNNTSVFFTISQLCFHLHHCPFVILLNSTISVLIIGLFSFCLNRTTSTTSSELWHAPSFPNTSFTQSTSEFPVLFFRLKIIIIFFLVSSSLVLVTSLLITDFFTIISDSTFSNLSNTLWLFIVLATIAHESSSFVLTLATSLSLFMIFPLNSLTSLLNSLISFIPVYCYHWLLWRFHGNPCYYVGEIPGLT